MYREKFGITLLTVLQGMTPRYLSDKDKAIEKSLAVWSQATGHSSNDEVKGEILKSYGSNFYYQEIVSSLQ